MILLNVQFKQCAIHEVGAANSGYLQAIIEDDIDEQQLLNKYNVGIKSDMI